MSFFDAPHVKRAIEEANFLRRRLDNQTQIVLKTQGQDEQVALEFLHTLYATVEKEHQLYLRFRLSDNDEALEAAAQLDGAKVAAEHPDFASGDQFYRKLKEDIKQALSAMDDTDLEDVSELW